MNHDSSLKPIHFDARCAERGIRSVDPSQLRVKIEDAVRIGGTDEITKVFDMDELSSLWRFFVEEGCFYAVVGHSNGRCVTVYTQEMVRNQKRARRVRKRMTGKRERSADRKTWPVR